MKQAHRITLLILVPTAATLTALLCLSVVCVYSLQTRTLDRWFSSRMKSAKIRLSDRVSAKTEQLAIASDVLQRDQRISSLWQLADRDSLLAETSPILASLRDKYGISHIYFHNPDRSNFLRVHMPEKHGDLVGRRTLRRAVVNGGPIQGLELGALGTFTLRHVCPWTVDDKVLGFVELGTEFHFITDAMNTVDSIPAILLVQKKYLNREGWEKGMAALQRTADWDLLPERVVAGNSFGPISLEPLKKLSSLHGSKEQNIEISYGGKQYRSGVIPLRDTGGRDVAEMLVFLDITGEKAVLRRLIIAFSFFGLLLVLILLGSEYCLLQRLQDRLAAADRQTRQEAGLRQAFQEKTLKQTAAINQLQEELIAPAPVGQKLQNIADAAINIFDLELCCIWQTAPKDGGNVGGNLGRVAEAKSGGHEGRQTLNLAACSGKSAGACGGNNASIEVNGIDRLISAKEKSFLTNDAATDTRVDIRDWAAETGAVSFAAYRLRDEKGDAVGLFIASAKHPVSAEDDVLLSQLGETTSHVIIASHVEEKLHLAIASAESANQAKSRFIANISHELRTPLHGILSFATFGKKRAATYSRENLADYFNKIYRSGQNLLELVDDLLDISKMESEKVEITRVPSNIHDLIQVIIEEFSSYAEQRNITFHLDSQDNASEIVYLDPERIAQVIRNLLGNAVKYSHDGGAVEISLHQASNKLTVCVSDSGVGIPEDELEAVFDKFIQSSRTRTGAGGTGLGLAICREIIAAHNGKIWAESSPTGGAKLTFVIPCNPNDPVDFLEEHLKSLEHMC